ncbi:MAG TPA: GNAT family N-acetyltransferase [Gaiellaceae bacterium]|nr:GNAT family N-acetyltransferase [Gaiellaceae bacterium]
MVETRPLTFPEDGIQHDGLLFRLPRLDDVDAVAPAFQDEAVGGAANMPRFTADELRGQFREFSTILEQGVMIPLVVLAEGEIQGGGTLHHFDWEHGQVEIGYWLFTHTRGRGTATKMARFLAEYGFSLGLQRIEARVFAGNTASERVLERAGFTREGVIRSMPMRAGGRADQTLFSLLPGE